MTNRQLIVSPDVRKIRPYHIGEIIKRLEYFGQDGFEEFRARRLLVYREGVYVPRAEETIAKLTRTVLEANRRTEEWSSRLSDETAKYISLTAQELPPSPPTDRLNVKNGLLDLETGRLHPHDPKMLSVIQLPVTYDANAKCPAWEKQIAATFPSDAVEAELAFHIVAYLMLPITSIQKAILLLGEGGTGKSTFLEAVLQFIGKHNASAIPLHKLESDRFAAAGLLGKLVNVCADLPSTHLETSSAFKNITGGDRISAEFKHRDQFFFTHSRGWSFQQTSHQ